MRALFGMEKGIRLFKENSDTEFVDILFGDNAPIGVSGETDEAPIGSLYSDRINGALYKKEANTSSATDWKEVGNVSLDELVWRNEKVRFATNDTLAAGNVDITTLTDNEGMVIGDINVGEYCIGDVDGTPVLFEITAKPGGDDITIALATPAIADNNTFVVQQYLPDSPASQEQQAIVHFPTSTSAGIKIGDINWNFADGINLAASYLAQNGTISSADTVNSAIEKLDGNQQDIQTASGIAQGDTDYGTFTGDIIPDGSTNKAALQALETAIEAQAPVNVGPANIAQATPTVVDTVLVDECQGVEWEVTAHDIGDPTNVKKITIEAIHDGHAGADAVSVKDKVYARFSTGTFNLQANAVLSGVGAAQTLGLQLNTSDVDGIRYTVARRDCIPAL